MFSSRGFVGPTTWLLLVVSSSGFATAILPSGFGTNERQSEKFKDATVYRMQPRRSLIVPWP
jgi:hypothetical protein